MYLSFPWAGHISEALVTVAQKWSIDIPSMVVGFTTDSGSNIVKALEEMNVSRLGCAGHTMNLAVQKALQIQQVIRPIG